MRRVGLLLLFCAVCTGLEAADVKGVVSVSCDGAFFNAESPFNPNNTFSYNDFSFEVDPLLTVKSADEGPLSCLYSLAVSYCPQQIETDQSAESLLLKEAFATVTTDLFSFRIGKYFLKWGSASFFNPIDVVNLCYDPQKLLGGSEGNPNVELEIPIGDSLGLLLVSFLDTTYGSLVDIPFVVQAYAAIGPLDGFAFVKIQKDEETYYGGNIDLAIPLSTVASLRLYGDALYARHADINVYGVEDALVTTAVREVDNALALSAGVSLSIPFTLEFLQVSSSFDLLVEYYYDARNWTGDEFQGYLDALARDPAAYASDYSAFRVSPQYLYSSITVNGALLTDLSVGAWCVANLSDGSALIAPFVQFALTRASSVGAECRMYTGGTDTEFGSSAFLAFLSFSLSMAF
jgi:hypothetical protein